MSGYVRPALISAIADSIGISDLSEEVARVLAPDVEYRVRDILQEARKFSRHGCRRRLECPDVNYALQARDMEQLYGMNSDDRRRYSKIAGASDAFQIDDTLHRCQDLIHQPLPPPPLEVGVSMHWFIVNGIKPRIPENAVPSQVVKWHQDKIAQANSVEKASGGAAAPASTATAGTEAVLSDSLPGPSNAGGAGTAMIAALDNSGTHAVLMPVVKHSITEELSELLRICAKVLLEPAEEVGADHPVFATLAADAGLDAAVPYIVTMIARGARENPHDLPLLWRLLWAAHSLIRNQTNNAAAYLSQLLPALLTLLLNNCLGPSGCNHFRLRRQAAAVLGDVADRYRQPNLNMRARIAATCMKALRKRPVRLCTSYGALQGLQALGGRTLRLLLLPELGNIHNAMLPCLSYSAQDHRSALKVSDAEHCLIALREAACAACRHGAVEMASAGLSAAAMSSIASLDTGAPGGKNRRVQARQAVASAVDMRIKELEAQARKALQEGRQLREQRLQQVQALQRVEAAAKATLEPGDASSAPQRNTTAAAGPGGNAAGSNAAGSHAAGSHAAGSHAAGSHAAGNHAAGSHAAGSNAAGPQGQVADAAAAARAAARMAAESFDPARAGGTALGDPGSIPVTHTNGADTGGDVEVLDSPPGSPLFVPPPPKSPVPTPLSGTGGQPAQPQHSQAQPHITRQDARPHADARSQPPGSAAPNQHRAQTSGQPVSAGPAPSAPSANASAMHNINGKQGEGAGCLSNSHGQAAPDSAPHAARAAHIPQLKATNGHLAAGLTVAQKGAHETASIPGQPCSVRGNDVPHKTQPENTSAMPAMSPRRASSAHNTGSVPLDKVLKNKRTIEAAGAQSSMHFSEAQQPADSGMQQALKEGHALGLHVAVVCELYGEAVLPWLGLDRVGGVFL